MQLASIRKALMAAAAAAVAAGVTAYPDGFTDAEIATILGAAVAAGFAVFKIPNKPETPQGAS